MTSLRGPGERNFNAVSHKPTRAPIQSVPVAPVSFGLWDTALKCLSPGLRSDVTDHLASVTTLSIALIWAKTKPKKTQIAGECVNSKCPKVVWHFNITCVLVYALQDVNLLIVV